MMFYAPDPQPIARDRRIPEHRCPGPFYTSPTGLQGDSPNGIDADEN